MQTQTLQPVSDLKHLRRARNEALGLSGLLLVIAASAILGLWIASQRVEKNNFHHYVVGLLKAASSQVDPQLHERIRRPEQLNDADYIRAVTPLRALRHAVTDIHYLYTLAWDGHTLRFVLDSADQEPDQRRIGEVFPILPTQALDALGASGSYPVVSVLAEPSTTPWGPLMAGFAPIRSSHGGVVALVGLAVDASLYLQHLREGRYRATLGLVPAACLIVLVGFLFYRVRLKGLTLEAALIEAAQRDKLTGLPNRRVFIDLLTRAVNRVQAEPGTGFAVLFLDFDRFKIINDTLGHESGDELLRQIGQRLLGELGVSGLSDSAHGSYVVSRFGGDEFLVLSNEAADACEPARLALRILQALAKSYDLKGSEVHSMASIGIVTSKHGGFDAEEFVRKADLAMYEAKRRGGGRYVEFDSRMHERVARRAAIEAGLHRAIGTPEIYLEYQPIIDLRTGARPYVEVLLRWQHPELGAIPPSEFIPVAEETGLMLALDDWMLNESCCRMVQWRRDDSACAPQYLSINTSRTQLAIGAHLLAQLRAILQRTDLPPQCLQFEVTERESNRDPQATRELLLQLRAMGVKLAMDDFGAGAFSLALLRTCPFDLVKMDRAFLKDLDRNEQVVAIVHAIVQLVENLGMASVAQGIENAQQLGILQSMGCSLGQGFFLAPPVSPNLVPEAMTAARPSGPGQRAT